MGIYNRKSCPEMVRSASCCMPWTSWLSGGVQPYVFRSLLLFLKKLSTLDCLQVVSVGECRTISVYFAIFLLLCFHMYCFICYLLVFFFLLLHWTFRLLVYFILEAKLKEFRRNGSAGIIFTNPLYYRCLRCHVLMCSPNPLIHKAEGWANEAGAPLGCLWVGISYSTVESCYHYCALAAHNLLQIEQ